MPTGIYVRSKKDKERIIKNLRLPTHRMSSTKFYNVFRNIQQRCQNPKSNAYKWYGGRGIKCLWHNFEEFKNDMFSSYKLGLSIDRSDNNGDYCKENCKWVGRKEQMRNTRQNRVIEFNGQKFCLTEWAEKLGTSYALLRQRLDRDKMSVERAFIIKS